MSKLPQDVVDRLRAAFPMPSSQGVPVFSNPNPFNLPLIPPATNPRPGRFPFISSFIPAQGLQHYTSISPALPSTLSSLAPSLVSQSSPPHPSSVASALPPFKPILLFGAPAPKQPSSKPSIVLSSGHQSQTTQLPLINTIPLSLPSQGNRNSLEEDRICRLRQEIEFLEKDMADLERYKDLYCATPDSKITYDELVQETTEKIDTQWNSLWNLLCKRNNISIELP